MEETDTLRQALEKMEHHGYAAVPLLSTEGKYLGTLTDGDVLWGLKELNFPSLYQMEEIPVMQVNRSRDNKPVHVDVDMEGLRQALEKMEHHGYAAVPLLSTEGKYLGTLTDGDVLWGLKELNFPSLYQMEEIPVMQVNRSRDNKPVHVDVDMEGLLEKVSAQNFVPVIDDEKVFIGIITRRDVIHYLAKQCRSREEAAV